MRGALSISFVSKTSASFRNGAMRFIGTEAIAPDSDDSPRIAGDSFHGAAVADRLPSFRRAMRRFFSSTSSWPG